MKKVKTRIKKMEEYIPQKIFCLRLGISRSTCKEFLKKGVVKYDKSRPFGNAYMIEWYSNKASVIRNSRDPNYYTPEAISKRQAKRRIKTYAEEDAAIESDSLPGKSIDEIMEVEEPEDEDGEFDSQMSKREAEAVKQLYLAKQAKLKYLKESGIVVESARVIREWEEIALAVQKVILAIPARVSELFASMDSAKEIQDLLTQELIHGLSRMKYEHKIENGESVEEGN